MDYVIEKKIGYLHVKTNNLYFKNEEISQSEYDVFQNSDSPETLGFQFEKNLDVIDSITQLEL
jgi:hypothetical protein